MIRRTSHLLAKKAPPQKKQRSAKRLSLYLVLACLMIAYFFQITLASSRGYELSKLNDQKRSLSEETGKIDLQIATEGSSAELQKRVHDLGLAPATGVQYIAAPDHSVALK